MPRNISLESNSITDERIPVSEALFAQICRASPNEARTLSLLLLPSERAQLALFCNARSHLRDRGRAIAEVCTEESLTLEGGYAGLVLFGQTKSGPETWGVLRGAAARQSGES